MTKSCISVYINYEKNNNGIYDIELINNTEDNNKAVEEINNQCKISYKLYNDILSNIEYMNDDNYKSIVEKINKNKNEEIEVLKRLHNEELKLNGERIIMLEETKRKCIEARIACNELNFNDRLSIEVDKIKNIHQMELNNLNNQIELYKNEFDKNKLDKENIYNQIFETYNSMSYKIDNMDKYFNKYTPSSVSGEIGEEFIFNYLSTYVELADADLKKVNGKSNAGDMLLQYNNLNCCIEAKNHTAPITQAQIKRFLQTDLNNPIYNCGIFISIKSDFAEINNIKHFDIRYENSKPSIFLSNFIARPKDIILAIKILDFIIHNNKCNSVDTNNYISMLMNNLDMLNTLIEINSDNIKNLNKSNTLIKHKQIEIEELLNIPKVNELGCMNCKKVFKKQTNLTKHMLTCKALE